MGQRLHPSGLVRFGEHFAGFHSLGIDGQNLLETSDCFNGALGDQVDLPLGIDQVDLLASDLHGFADQAESAIDLTAVGHRQRQREIVHDDWRLGCEPIGNFQMGNRARDITFDDFLVGEHQVEQAARATAGEVLFQLFIHFGRELDAEIYGPREVDAQFRVGGVGLECGIEQVEVKFETITLL